MSGFSLRKGDIVTVTDAQGCPRRAVVSEAHDASGHWGVSVFDEASLIFINEPSAESAPDPDLSERREATE